MIHTPITYVYTRLVVVLMILMTQPSAAQKIRSFGPDWSPDGNRIVYYSSRDGNNEIYIYNLIDSTHTRITHNNRSDALPKFSPDGKKLIYFSGGAQSRNIFVYDLLSLEEKQITDDEAKNEDPNWIDNSTIVYNSNKSGNFEIYTLDLNSGIEQQLTNNPLRDFTPSVSPDKSKLVFIRGELGKETAIFTMNLDGSDQKKLTDAFNEYGPSWSSDGSAIIFMGKKASNNIYFWDFDQKVITQLTQGKGNNTQGAVSPDGQFLAFASNRDTGNYEIYVMEIATKKVTRLTFDSTHRKN